MSEEKVALLFPKNKCGSSALKFSKSLFEDADYELDKKEKLSEFGKIYQGLSLKLDEISINEQYLAPKRKKV